MIVIVIGFSLLGEKNFLIFFLIKFCSVKYRFLKYFVRNRTFLSFASVAICYWFVLIVVLFLSRVLV